MSIQVAITPKEFRQAQRLLAGTKTVICLSREIYIKHLLVARHMLLRGNSVNAKIERGYK